MKKIFILISSNQYSGPVKGAYALANLLSNKYNVSIITIKPHVDINVNLCNNIKYYCLNNSSSSFIGKIFAYKKILKESGGKDSVISLSMTLSADFINLFCINYATTYVSIRGNLLKNYYYDYGLSGYILAIIHLFSLRWCNKVIAMSNAMSKQIKLFSNKNPVIIENFVDELSLDLYRTEVLINKIPKFIFIGNLNERKQPLLLLESFIKIKRLGINATLDIVGNGPLLSDLENQVSKYKLEKDVIIHGFVENPLHLLRGSDILVLPSLSEGISRASLEALYLGIPCVLRNVDGNSELINDGINGILFNENYELSNAMLKALKLLKVSRVKENLLPSSFRQENVFKKFVVCIGNGNG